MNEFRVRPRAGNPQSAAAQFRAATIRERGRTRTKSMQGDLFAVLGELVRSPICSYVKHCGAMAMLGEPEDLGDCINRSITCQRCGATGVESTNKEAEREL